ncbi:hypothetical protein AXX17_AT5G27250 [Arabidopsis thaliana]|uniref:Uncharacterized protein n=1 Tax=Arabidopsis thaliana TaxID=3702 RepID=A0A178UFH5_ARATH|nr:hypothetical protein AXX17_AT5G27250 [Arabidopsis thaliana]
MRAANCSPTHIQLASDLEFHSYLTSRVLAIQASPSWKEPWLWFHLSFAPANSETKYL